MTPETHIPRETAHRLARRTLFGFLITFLLARVCVFLIMADALPNFYFFLHGTHVHHLNYGIFLLATVTLLPFSLYSVQAAKAAAAKTATMFSRINTLLSIPMLFSMVAAGHLY